MDTGVRSAKYVGRVRRGTRSITFNIREGDDLIEVSVPRSKLEGFMNALNGMEREFRSAERDRANAAYENEVRESAFGQMLQLPQQQRHVNPRERSSNAAGARAASANRK